MRTYKFKIRNTPAALKDGNIVEQVLFSCQFLADRDTDVYAFAERLFSFWEENKLIGEAQNEWLYEYDFEQV